MSDSSQRKNGMILSYFSIIINTIIQLLYTPLLIRMLGQSEYGLYSLVNSVVGYLTVLDFGFDNAIVVYTAKYRAKGLFDEEKKLHGMFRLIFFIISIIAILLGIILYLNVDNFYGKTLSPIELSRAKIMMLILTFNLGVTFMFNIYSSIIKAYEKFVFQKVLAILSSILKPIIMIPLLFMGYKSICMILVITLVNVGVVISNWLYCKNKLNIKIKFSGFDKKLFKTILGYSIWLFLCSIVDKINWSADNFILGAVSGTIAVSLYSIGGQLNTLFINLSNAISHVLLPKMSKLIANSASKEKITNEFIKVGRIQFFVIYLMATGLIIFGKDFINLWVGKSYSTSYYVALILIIPTCFPLIQNLGLSIMQSMNKYQFKAITTFIMAMFNIIISIFLAKKYGAVGAAIGTALLQIICNIIIINIYYYKDIGIDVIKFWKNIIKMILKILPLTILVGIVYNVIYFSPIANILIYGVIYCVLYGVLVYFFTMNIYEKGIVNGFIKKVIKRKVK